MNSAEIDWEIVSHILEKHQMNKWALIPLLQDLQESFGYIPPETIESIAEALNLSASHIQGVITFYAGFSTEPRGKCILKVCRGDRSLPGSLFSGTGNDG